ncbi:hypothetical protein SLEP1_g27600 [Rubroshorea leprosula]|uniref:Uncharacterized protein n=1 Tax=Rubroshorea leprosula TaxID=152421 RepID=A0AAV5K081_9ROSI|nr:hypothetical protein SLEP1_g27600 [Rubroshorea leprosula]
MWNGRAFPLIHQVTKGVNLIKPDSTIAMNMCRERWSCLCGRGTPTASMASNTMRLMHVINLKDIQIHPSTKSEEVGAAQKKRMVEEHQEERRDKIVEFIPCPSPVELDPEPRESVIIAKRSINASFPEVDYCREREEVLSHGGVGIVWHVLEERNTLEKEKEKKELGKKKEEVEKDLVKVMPKLKEFPEENDSLKTKLVFEEKKKKMCEDKAAAELGKSVNLWVHNAMKDHIVEKTVKAQHPEVDVIGITFEEQRGVEENGESRTVDFCLEIKLKWDHNNEGRTVFPPNFNFEFIVVEEEEPEVARGAKVRENEPEQKVN